MNAGKDSSANTCFWSGGYSNAEKVTDTECMSLAAHIEEGYLQAERGELTDGVRAQSEIAEMKETWRLLKR